MPFLCYGKHENSYKAKKPILNIHVYYKFIAGCFFCECSKYLFKDLNFMWPTSFITLWMSTQNNDFMKGRWLGTVYRKIFFLAELKVTKDTELGDNVTFDPFANIPIKGRKKRPQNDASSWQEIFIFSLQHLYFFIIYTHQGRS